MFDKWGKLRIFALGDIHGKWQIIRNFYEKYKETENFILSNRENNIIILLGDAGLNYFFNHRDIETKTKLNTFPFTYFVVRGNHEERPSICAEKYPDKWHIEEFWDNMVYVENDYPNIKYALDEAAIYNVPYFYKALVIPGAYSVDKYYRLKNNWSWFENEQLNEQEKEKCIHLVENNQKIDFIFSHTCPIIFEPTDLFLSCIDQSMVDKSMERLLGEVECHLNYRAWMWGHYHAFRDYPRTDGRKKIMLFNNYAIDVIDYLENEEFKKYEI